MKMHIGSFEIDTKRTFIIAEIGNNHNGSFKLAGDLIDKARDSGADCVNFRCDI